MGIAGAVAPGMMLAAEGCTAWGVRVKAGLGWRRVKNQRTLTISFTLLV